MDKFVKSANGVSNALRLRLVGTGGGVWPRDWVASGFVGVTSLIFGFVGVTSSLFGVM